MRGRTCVLGCLLIFEATIRVIWATYSECDVAVEIWRLFYLGKLKSKMMIGDGHDGFEW